MTINQRSMITRWDEWYSEENLSRDRRIGSAPPSHSAEKAVQAFLARRNRFILDLACGIGRDTRYLQGCGLSVAGVDASFNGLRTAKQLETRQGAGWITADARRLPFKDGSFEGVYCFGLLHEFTGGSKEEDVEQVMGEVRRVLFEQGLLVLAVLGGEPEAGLPAVQLFTCSMFEKAAQGFQVIEIEKTNDVGCTGRADYEVWYGVFEK